MIMIGLVIGLVATLLKQCLIALDSLKWEKTREFAQSMDLTTSYGWTAGLSVVFIIISSFLIAFIHPPAGGSGVPEVTSYLNGVIVHGTMSLKNLVVKFISLVFAVSSGVPQATQGPMISFGAIIGQGIGQFKSKTLGFNPKWFRRFRTPEERRNFMTAGVAAGVAAAFNAPIGGLLWAQEDVSSFWSNRIAWQTFFGCGIATVVANMFNSAFSGFQFQGSFGLLSATTPDPIPLNVVSLVPAIVMGILGGLVGAFYTRLNTALIKLRKRIIGTIPHPVLQKLARMLETVIIVLIMAAVVVWFPSALGCSPNSQYNQTEIGGCGFGTEMPVEYYTCCEDPNNCTKYSEAASLFYGQQIDMWTMLTAKGVHQKFSYTTLLYVFLIYFAMLMWTTGSSIAAGVFVPILNVGALYGRAIGLGFLDIYQAATGSPVPTTKYWAWLDPGMVAVLGAGSLLAGVNRRQLAITVIIAEMSQDIDIICPLLLANFLAKSVADLLSKPIYQYQLEARALPYLDNEVTVVIDGTVQNLELHSAKEIMSDQVIQINVCESLKTLAKVLYNTSHGAFPVVKRDEFSNEQRLHGLISRNELYVILCSKEILEKVRKLHECEDDSNTQEVSPDIGYEELSVDFLSDPSKAEERIQHYCFQKLSDKIIINLSNFVNISATKVDRDHSLQRTYSLFRTLGLRHLLVTDERNKCVGIITRKDLMPFHIKECLSRPVENSEDMESQSGSSATSLESMSDNSLHISL